MKKITLLFILLTTVINWSYSQCTSIPGGNYPAGLMTVFNDGSAELISNDNWGAGEYSAITGLISGNTYTVTGTNTTGIYITIAEIDWNAPAVGGTVLGHGASSVSFTATTTDIIIHWHLDALCGTTGNEDTVTTIQCTSASCNCTDTAAPACASNQYPADAAIDVVTATAADNSREVTISWDAVPSAVAYEIEWGGTVLGSTPNTSVTIYGLSYSSQYTWRVNPVNCYGTNSSCSTLTFTTEADPSLSVEELSTENVISHYYNTATNELVLKSSTKAFTSVAIYSILGQQVVRKNLSQNTETINVSQLSNGVYIAKVAIDGKEQTIKFVKK